MKFKSYKRNLQLFLIFIHSSSLFSQAFFIDWRFFQTTFDNVIASTNARSIDINANVSEKEKEVEGTIETELSSVESGSVKCFGELGCVEINDGWFDLLHRPINLLPFDRGFTRFYLANKNNNSSNSPIEIYPNKTSILEAGFEAEKHTKFIIHGFIDTGFSSWVGKMANAFNNNGDFNIIIVDWGAGSLPLYTQAVANIRLVGLEIANLIKVLMDEFNVQPETVHLIGHSLGSHASSYAGDEIKKLGKKIGRITGLDPAEPYFASMPDFVRLEISDANLVDVIHTDGRVNHLSLGYGMMEAIGHMDFYPNDGSNQPGCEIANIPINLIKSDSIEDLNRNLIACNHQRAIHYFIDSISKDAKCKYVSHVCTNFVSYANGECYNCGKDGSLCSPMGMEAYKYPIENRTHIPFYLSTGKTDPFCVYHYRVNLQLAFPRHASPWVTGKLIMDIVGEGVSIKNIKLAPPDTNMKIDHGTNLTFLVQSNTELGSIERIRVEWKYDFNYYELTSYCLAYLCNRRIFIKKITITDIDNDILFTNSKNSSLETNKIRKEDFPEKDQNLCGLEGTKYTGISSGSFFDFLRHC